MQKIQNTQKVVIIGCGWLGQQLGTLLAAQGFLVYGSRQSSAGLAELPAEIQPLLLQLPLHVLELELTGILKDSWLICAIPPAARQQSAADYAQQLQSLVEVATVAGVRGAIHCSSTGVYQGLSGDVDEQSLLPNLEQSELQSMEQSPAGNTKPQNCRAAALLEAEQILQQIPNCFTLRLAGLIGPGRNPARFGQGRTLSGPQLPVNLVHAADIGRFVLNLLTTTVAPHHQLFNLCCPEHPLKADFYHTAAVQAGLPPVSFSAADEPARRILSRRSQQQPGFEYQFLSPLQALTSC
ncbi:epimerase [Rheinheimera riviphila]|uniref:Epimerase n=1 Tax=Rheinheimera riviphila TaxID=1834037 RepID=A0A437R0K9_9GAMM|nr:epimerase [Rheinheimera riviphila]RVU40316.1 epimerase [Rheinheimera riviphila]